VPGKPRLAGRRRYERGASHLVLVVQRHESIERMPGRHDIGDPGVGRNPAERRVRLDEAPVPLCVKLGVYALLRRGRAVQPRRKAPERIRQVRRPEDQQCANHLHPGRPGLARGADHDVAGPEAEAEPPAAVLAGRLIADLGTGHAVSVAEAGRYRRASGAAA